MEITKEIKETVGLLETFKIIKPIVDLESALEKTIFITDEIVAGIETKLKVPVNDLRGDRVSLHWFVVFINERINDKESFPRRYSVVGKRDGGKNGK